jgi:hypothetical protein
MVGVALALCLAGANQSAYGFEAAKDYRLLVLDGHRVKWGHPTAGTGATVRYAFVDKPVRFEGAINCGEMVPIGRMLAASEIAPSLFSGEVAAAFALWQASADISFRETSDPAASEILIGAQAKPRGWAYANVSYQPGDGKGTRTILKALICLNPDRPWKVGFGGNITAYDLRYTIAHEIGHAIGLDHPGPSGQVMSFVYGERFRGLQEGDIGGVVALYGKRRLHVTDGPVAPPAPQTWTARAMAAPAPAPSPQGSPAPATNAR